MIFHGKKVPDARRGRIWARVSIKIKEKKLAFIKCLYYECKEKLTDEFILKFINKNKELIKKIKNIN